MINKCIYSTTEAKHVITDQEFNFAYFNKL